MYVGDLFVNAELVRQGYAQPATYPPDVLNANLFVALAATARAEAIGCYALTAPPAATFYVTGTQGVNIRSCASTSCAIVGAAAYGAAIAVISTANNWHEIRLGDGRSGFIAAWLTGSSPPSVAPARPAARPQAAPQQAVPARPALPPAFVCDCSKTCPMMVSRQEAYFQLQQCGCRRRDGDSDGVPCEDICPGG